MSVVRIDVHFEDLDELVRYANVQSVVVSIVDADTIVTLASRHDQVTRPVGVWLELSDDYPPQMAARDVKTLSWLVPLECVVVGGPHAEARARVLEALLSDDEVNFTNAAATLVGAYNRPKPPRPVAVWSWDGAILQYGDDVLREASSQTNELGESTTYR
jgi:hypothetical protein